MPIIKKTRSVEYSPDGLYKMITREKSGSKVDSRKVKEKRTLKGVLKGAPKSSGVLENTRNSDDSESSRIQKARAGKQMIKRADGSYSQRGLWDNIRAAKGSGKKPTAQMLKQEKKIKAQSKKK
jgi:hypothetical protein